MGHTTEAVERATHAKGSLEKDRFILQQLVTKDFKLRYRPLRARRGLERAQPAAHDVIMSFVFSYFLRGSNVENYPLYLIVGNVTFGLMNEATSTGLRSIIDAAPLLKKVKVDRWVFPVQKVLSAMVNFALSLIAVVIVMLFFRIAPTWHIVWMLPALLLLMLFCVGISLLIGAAAVFFRDMIHLWERRAHGLDLPHADLLDLSLLTNAGAPQFVVWVVKANPMYNYLEMMRCAIVYQSDPTTTVILLAVFWALLALALGYFVFRKTSTSSSSSSRTVPMADTTASEYAIEVNDVSMIFNIASEQLNNLKEYFIKIMRHELFFKEFRALNHVSFKVRRGEVVGLVGTNGSASPRCSSASPACSSPPRAPSWCAATSPRSSSSARALTPSSRRARTSTSTARFSATPTSSSTSTSRRSSTLPSCTTSWTCRSRTTPRAWSRASPLPSPR